MEVPLPVRPPRRCRSGRGGSGESMVECVSGSAWNRLESGEAIGCAVCDHDPILWSSGAV